MDIGRQRISAVRTLGALGYSYRDGEWLPPTCPSPALQLAEADAMHGLLMRRADAIAGCTEGTAEEADGPLLLSNPFPEQLGRRMSAVVTGFVASG